MHHHMLIHMHVHTHPRTHEPWHTHSRTQLTQTTHIHMHACTSVHTYIHKRTHTHSLTHEHKSHKPHTYTCIPAHLYTHVYTYTHTHIANVAGELCAVGRVHEIVQSDSLRRCQHASGMAHPHDTAAHTDPHTHDCVSLRVLIPNHHRFTVVFATL